VTVMVVSFFQEENGVTPSVSASDDTHPSDATATIHNVPAESSLWSSFSVRSSNCCESKRRAGEIGGLDRDKV